MKVTYTQRAAMLAREQLDRLEQHIAEKGDRDDNLVSFFRKANEAEATNRILTYLVIGAVEFHEIEIPHQQV